MKKTVAFVIAAILAASAVPCVLYAKEGVSVSVIAEFPPEIKDIGVFREGRAKIATLDFQGFIDRTGTVVIPMEYEAVGTFRDGLASVSNNGKCGFIDRNGEIIVPLEYDGADRSSYDGSITLYIYDENGWILHADEYRDGKIYTLEDDGNGDYYRKEYDVYLGSSEGFELVQKDGKYGFLDCHTWTLAIPLEYDCAELFSEGLAAVEREGKKGYIDHGNNLVIPMDGYDGFGSFSEGMAWVRGKNGKYGFVDKAGNLAVPLEYDGYEYGFYKNVAGMFKESVDCYRKDCYLINRDGEILEKTDMRYSGFYGGLSMIRPHYDDDKPYNGLYIGFADMNGDIVVPMRYYMTANNFSEGLAGVRLDGIWSILKAEDFIPEQLFGDVDGDGEINGGDLICLKRHILDWGDYTGTVHDGDYMGPGKYGTEFWAGKLFADVDGDGEVTGEDLICLKRHILDWDDYTGDPVREGYKGPGWKADSR